MLKSFSWGRFYFIWHAGTSLQIHLSFLLWPILLSTPSFKNLSPKLWLFPNCGSNTLLFWSGTLELFSVKSPFVIQKVALVNLGLCPVLLESFSESPACVLSIFPTFAFSSFRSMFDPWWADFCVGWEIQVKFQFSACMNPVLPGLSILFL